MVTVPFSITPKKTFQPDLQVCLLIAGMFINSAFDMARDISITPKRVSYARAKEDELFRSLMDIANRKQEEIKV